MDNYEKVLKLFVEAVQQTKNITSAEKPTDIPTGISNRHLHLSQKDMDVLFGKDYEMTKIKDLSQPGQFACKEMVTICGPKGAIEKVRILGPVRNKTQVEILAGDGFKLGIKSQARLSGDLEGTPGVTIIGPKGSVQLSEGAIVAQRHIHMTLQEAQCFGVKDGDVVSIEIDGPRGGIFKNVAIRANDASALECHIDTEEANAMSINSLSKIKIIKQIQEE